MAVFRKDPCGLICLFFTYGAVFYADYCVVEHVVIPTLSDSVWGAFHVFAFNIVVLLLIISHARASFSDPGIVPLPESRLDFSEIHKGQNQTNQLTVDGISTFDAHTNHQSSTSETDDSGPMIGHLSTDAKAQDENTWTVCTKCETYRPPRAHHCRTCGRCIKKMDHHCPWINNCVGECNQKFFVLFLFYTGIACVYAAILTAVSWTSECIACTRDYEKRTRMVYTIILMIESCLFGLFVLAMMCDQFSAISSDMTAVENVQRQIRANRKPRTALLAEVFGRGTYLIWFCPCSSSNNTHSVPTSERYNV